MKYVGIAGGGNISNSHLKAALEIEGVQIAAVYGQNAKKVAELAGRGDATPYSNLDEFVKHRPMDLVAIGSPSGCHVDQGIAAARQGLHVLVEKPIDVSAKKADLLIDECRRSGVKLGVFFQDRVSRDIQRLKEIIVSGDLGRLILGTAHVKWYRPPEYYSDSKWRGTWSWDGGGAVMNQGIHTVDLVLWLFGNVRKVFAFSKTGLHSIEAEDTAVAVMEFENGAIGTFEAATSAYPGQPRRLYVTGTEGTAFLEHDRLVSLELTGRENVEAAPSESERNLSESSPVVSDVTGHRLILEDFLESIEKDRRPVCDGLEGRRSVELVEAIYESARSGLPISLSG